MKIVKTENREPDRYVSYGNRGRQLLNSRFERFGYKQVPSSNERVNRSLPLPYALYEYKAKDWITLGSEDPMIVYHDVMYSSSFPSHRQSTERARAYNRAYGKAMDTIYPVRGALGVTLAQIDQSMASIDQRGSQLLQLGRLYASRDVRGFVNYLHETILPTRSAIADNERKFKVIRKRFSKRRVISRKRESHYTKLASTGGDIGGLWLETWFGWLPTVADIQAAAEVITSPICDQTITHSSGFTHTVKYTRSYPGYGTKDGYKSSCKGFVKIGFHVRVHNRNLALASQLGVLNPFLIGLDLIKFSWLIGWAVNLQQVLSSWTDFAGLTTSKAYVTDFYKMNLNSYWTSTHSSNPGSSSLNGEGVYLVRTTGAIPYPSLTLTLPSRLSLTRGLTSMSLLVKTLSNLNRK